MIKDINLNFVIILVLILIFFKFFIVKENFSNCSQYGDDYNQCYNNNCTIMLDMKGNAFCTNK